MRFIRASAYDFYSLPFSGGGTAGAGGEGGEGFEFVGQDHVTHDKRRGILMMGSAHTINVDAVLFVLDEVVPRLRRLSVTEEELVVHIIGPNMNHQTAVSEHVESKVVRLHGRVRGPELDALFRTSKVFLSPVVSGPASFKTKNLEALGRGLPVVTCRLGALGLLRPPSEATLSHTGVSIVACSPEKVAVMVQQYLQNASMWTQASDGARAFAQKHFHPRNLEREVAALLAADLSPKL